MLTLDFLPVTAYVFMLIFARVGAIAMALPGIGNRTVPRRVRLVFALMLAMVLYPTARAAFGDLPPTTNFMLFALGREIVVGLFIGFTVRLIMASLQVAGTVIAFQTGLAFAQNVDPSQGGQSAIVGTFLSVLATTLIFAADLHHLLLAAMVDSYTLFKPGAALPTAEFGQMAIDTLATSFRIAIQIAAPFLAFGMIFYMGMGVLSRLMPQVQIFFLAMPANIFVGFMFLLMLTSAMMIWFLDYFAAAIKPFLTQ